MWFTAQDFIGFWFSYWFQPLRSACPALSKQARQMADTEWTLPTWLRPLFLQRWIGQAIAQRVVWQATQATPPDYRYADSLPCWNKMAALPYDEKRLGQLPELDVLWLWATDAERLLRMAQTRPGDIGEDRWTQAMLGACGHLVQGYHELRRRLGYREARRLVRLLLGALACPQANRPIEQVPEFSVGDEV